MLLWSRMNLTAAIESAELSYRQILEDFFLTVYDETRLPSHGLSHHRRVWNYAKELLLSLPIQSEPFCNPAHLIIACYLHDAGMSGNPGPRHGIAGMELCRQFLIENSLDPLDYDTVLKAILDHDKKDYTGTAPESELLRILAAADDLDAFGFEGIYRYAEIYLLRGTDPLLLGQRIRENAEARFLNFTRSFGGDRNLPGKHGERYQILDSFYEEYNKQVQSYRFNTGSPSGHCGVIELIMRMNDEHPGREVLEMWSSSFSHEPVIGPFLKKLLSII